MTVARDLEGEGIPGASRAAGVRRIPEAWRESLGHQIPAACRDLGIRTLLRALTAFSLVAAPVGAQTPPDSVPPDTVPGGVSPADTLPDSVVPADTVGDTVPDPGAGADTIPGGAAPDSPAAERVDSLPTLEADSLTAADTVVLEHLPPIPSTVPPGWETGIWEWNREELLSTRATSLGELLEQVPGVIGLRGGDFGMPRSLAAFGSGGGGVRVFRDGLELLPLEGSVLDLSRVGTADAETVRLVRAGDGLEVHVRTLRAEDPRPYSRIQAGTGDLDTNLLEGLFFHPRALGGNAGLFLHRVDTRGPRRAQPGSATTVNLHYAYLRGDRLGLRADVTRSITHRDTLFTPAQVSRTDVMIRGRWRLMDGVVGELFWTRASMEADTTGADPQDFPFRNEARGQRGGRISAGYGPFTGIVTFRDLDGEGLQDRDLEAEVSALRPELGGVAADWTSSVWGGRSVSTSRIRAWSAPFYGLSAFGSVVDFERGVPALPPLAAPVQPPMLPTPPPEANPGFFEGRSIRVGGRFRWRGLDLSGARLELERDSVHPLGLPMDRGGIVGAAGRRSGWETSYRVPIPILDGLAVEGSGQIWEEATGRWSYMPRRTWQGALTFHDRFLPTGNLEVWADVGVQGRDPMAVAVPVDPGGDPPVDPERAVVPFYQSWYARLQIRVVTVRIFLRWENMTLRADNQDFPGRLLPQTRSMYGVRWTLWD